MKNLLGELIGEGEHRKIYNHKEDNSLVIKVEKSGNEHNMMEVWNWDNATDDMREWLAPIIDHSADYEWVMQKKIKIVDAGPPDKIPEFLKPLTDVYVPNEERAAYPEQQWGTYEGRLVVCDYGHRGIRLYPRKKGLFDTAPDKKEKI